MHAGWLATKQRYNTPEFWQNIFVYAGKYSAHSLPHLICRNYALKLRFCFVINDYLFIGTEGETATITTIDNNNNNNNAETPTRLWEMSLYLTINDDSTEK